MAGAERKLSTIIFLFTFFKNKFTITPALTVEMPFILAALLSVLERCTVRTTEKDKFYYSDWINNQTIQSVNLLSIENCIFSIRSIERNMKPALQTV